ncbi:hypothetical protein LOY55_09780 [Pseudomonas sp. B21-040]|uniref:hypothetical protein n=1 Tax=Pseudomonas sp. B21-040 TaxID=2895486 RepID=UPI002161032B|nr:hypothetical protein [Pseudomonas sp. B21-040]UVL42369.1 hypothetical protein LOY55_09780 [Pseudomonas sp. B21-040]
MSQEAVITIDGEYYSSGSCQFDDLQAAAAVLFDASEDQFEALKAERWYTRVFDIATFSQKKNIRMASQIQHLAQAQQILSEILVFLSQRDKQVFELFGQCQTSIEYLARQDVALAKRIIALENRVLLGLETLPTLEQLAYVEKQILAGLLLKFSGSQSATGVDQQTYANGLISLLQVEPAIGEPLLGALDHIREIETKRLMLVCCLEYLYLHSNSFEFDDDTQGVIDAFDFGDKTVKSLQDKVRAAQMLRGNAGLAGKFGLATNDLLEKDFFISFDEVEEPAFSAEPAELESFTISTVLHIPVGEERVFTNKDILIQSYVNCEGSLIFENCRIQYNVGDLPDRITLSEGARLKFVDSHVECKRIDEGNGYFVQGKGKNSVMCTNTLFDGCNHFLDVGGSDNQLDIQACIIKNPGKSFIHSHGYESTARIEKSVVKFSDISTELLSHYQSYGSIIHSSVAIEFNDCVFQGCESILEKSVCITLLDVKYGKLKSCGFFQIKNVVISADLIEECYFENCEDVYTSDYGNQKTILNSVFKRCNNVIDGIDINIENTQFFECGKRLVGGSGYKIRFCEFINTKPNDNSYSVSSGTSLHFLGSGDSAPSEITKCKFDGYDGGDCFLISASIFNKFSGSKVNLSECTFSNCRTTRPSGKIIKEFDFYYGLFNRRIETKPVSIYKCRGLDKINTERAKSEDAKPKGKTENGTTIGAAFATSALAATLVGGVPGFYAHKFLKDDDLQAE